MAKKLPRNTVARLSQYRRLLEKYIFMDEPFIFSHDLARMLGLKPVNVRHDLMLLGISGDRRKGYSVNALLEAIGDAMDMENRGVVLVGMGRLGMSLVSYLRESGARIQVDAAFDVDPMKVNNMCEGIPCYSIGELGDFARKNQTRTAILAVPAEDVNDVVPILLRAGINGILNYTSGHLNVPEGIIVRNIDMVSYLEEIIYFNE